MASMRSFVNHFISTFLLLSHLGCFFFTAKSPPSPKRRKLFPSHPNAKKFLSYINPFSSLKPILSSRKPKPQQQRLPAETRNERPSLSSARSSLQSTPSPNPTVSTPQRKRPAITPTEPDASPNLLPKCPSFSFRSDIFPCPTCGEVFPEHPLLECHKSAKHAVSELYDGDTSKNIVRIIFQSSWAGRENLAPTIHRILKIHNGPKILSLFEEYREAIKAKASRNAGKQVERCIADGNELLRFHCSTFVCSLGQNGSSGLCDHEFCGVCGIIRSGFSPKLDGIPTLGSSRSAHEAIPEEMEEEFTFMNVKRAMIVCRVVAGRIARDQGVVLAADKEDAGFDSILADGSSGTHYAGLEQELLVFSPRAVLPCFVIVYGV